MLACTCPNTPPSSSSSAYFRANKKIKPGPKVALGLKCIVGRYVRQDSRNEGRCPMDETENLGSITSPPRLSRSESTISFWNTLLSLRGEISSEVLF